MPSPVILAPSIIFSLLAIDAGLVSIIGHFSSLQFQYNYHGPGQSPDYEYISYVRTNYSGVFDNL